MQLNPSHGVCTPGSTSGVGGSQMKPTTVALTSLQWQHLLMNQKHQQNQIAGAIVAATAASTQHQQQQALKANLVKLNSASGTAQIALVPAATVTSAQAHPVSNVEGGNGSSTVSIQQQRQQHSTTTTTISTIASNKNNNNKKLTTATSTQIGTNNNKWMTSSTLTSTATLPTTIALQQLPPPPELTREQKIKTLESAVRVALADKNTSTIMKSLYNNTPPVWWLIFEKYGLDQCAPLHAFTHFPMRTEWKDYINGPVCFEIKLILNNNNQHNHHHLNGSSNVGQHNYFSKSSRGGGCNNNNSGGGNNGGITTTCQSNILSPNSNSASTKSIVSNNNNNKNSDGGGGNKKNSEQVFPGNFFWFVRIVGNAGK